MNRRIYLDNAATSWPKRPQVTDAVMEFITECGATAGRGTYRSAMAAERWIAEARLNLSRLIGAGQADSIAFCYSGTHALNAALAGLIREGQHVICTEIEHNSVLRPLRRLARYCGAEADFVRSDSRGVVCIEQAEQLLRPNTRWMVIGHASNVTGAVQDLEAWSRLARRVDAHLIVDASQTLGYLPIDVVHMGIDVLAAAGHKGLGGISGSGFLYARQDLQPVFEPLMTGGTGLNSQSIEFDNHWPQLIEVGNHNLPSIVSMAVAAEELLREAEETPIKWQVDWRNHLNRLVSGLQDIPGISLVGYPDPSGQGNSLPQTATDSASCLHGRLWMDRVPLVSLSVAGWDAQELAVVLDSDFGIEVRAGYHCAALIHRALGSLESGGTLRVSLGHHSREEEIDAVLAALRELALEPPNE